MKKFAWAFLGVLLVLLWCCSGVVLVLFQCGSGFCDDAVVPIKRACLSRAPEPFTEHVYPTHTRAFRNNRIQGASSCQLCGCQEYCTVRNTRSG